MAGAALALGLSAGAVSLVALPAQAQNTAPLANPRTNVPRTAAMGAACKDGANLACQDAVVQAIDNARATEGVKPLALPSYYDTLTEAQQLLVLADLERVDRGLPGFAGLSSSLDVLAQEAAESNSDPSGPADASWGSNWAGGEASALMADYDWMYDDGPGSPNLDCTSTDTSGCWAHRENVLGNYGTSPSMGAAVTSVDGVTSLTELFASSPAGSLDFRLPDANTQESTRAATPIPKRDTVVHKRNTVSPKRAPVAPKLSPSLLKRQVQVLPHLLQIRTSLGLPHVALLTVRAPTGVLSTTATVTGTDGQWSVSSECQKPAGARCELVVRFLGDMPGVATATVTVHLHQHIEHVKVNAVVDHSFWFTRPLVPGQLTFL